MNKQIFNEFIEKTKTTYWLIYDSTYSCLKIQSLNDLSAPFRQRDILTAQHRIRCNIEARGCCCCCAVRCSSAFYCNSNCDLLTTHSDRFLRTFVIECYRARVSPLRLFTFWTPIGPDTIYIKTVRECCELWIYDACMFSY